MDGILNDTYLLIFIYDFYLCDARMPKLKMNFETCMTTENTFSYFSLIPSL